MTVVNVTSARKDLYNLIKTVNENAEPVTIVNSKGENAVLLGEEEWRAIEETIYLNSMPDMARKILEGGATRIEDCTEYDEGEEW